MEMLRSMFFILLGTCGAAANILFAIAYLRAARRSSIGPSEIGRFSLFVAGYEVAVFLLLSNMALSGTAALVAVGIIQLLAYRSNVGWTQVALETLTTHLPNSEGPKVVGSCLVFMLLLSIFLLLGTPLRDESLWVRFLFTALMPISAFCGVALLAIGARRT